DAARRAAVIPDADRPADAAGARAPARLPATAGPHPDAPGIPGRIPAGIRVLSRIRAAGLGAGATGSDARTVGFPDMPGLCVGSLAGVAAAWGPAHSESRDRAGVGGWRHS